MEGGGVGVSVTVCELTAGAALPALDAQWNELLARAASNVLFLTPTFQHLWWETLGVGEPRVIVGEAAPGRLRFVAPLFVSGTEQGRAVQLVGGAEVADYLDIVAAPDDLEAAWRTVFQHLAADAATWDAIALHALPAWSPSRAIVPRLAAEHGWAAVECVDDVCPVVALPASWSAYLAGLRKKDRHEIRRKLGRLEREAADERFALVGPDDDLTAALDDFFRLHRLSGQEKEGFWTADLDRFFRRLIVAAHAQGWLRLAFQSVNGQRVATVLAFRYGDRYYVYNSGYDPAYRDLAVGVVCMSRTIQAAITEGAACFDLLQGDEPYKYDFGAVNTPVYRITIQRAAS